MAMTRAERSSCGDEHSNHTHAVGPRAPSPCKAYFRRAAEPREFGCLHLEAKASHANQTTGLASQAYFRALVLFASPKAELGLPKHIPPNTAVSQGPRRLSLTGMHSPGCIFGRPIYFQTRVGFESPDAMIFTSLGLGDKGAFVHLAPQMPLMGPLPRTHHVSQRLWSTK